MMMPKMRRNCGCPDSFRVLSHSLSHSHVLRFCGPVGPTPVPYYFPQCLYHRNLLIFSFFVLRRAGGLTVHQQQALQQYSLPHYVQRCSKPETEIDSKNRPKEARPVEEESFSLLVFSPRSTEPMALIQSGPAATAEGVKLPRIASRTFHMAEAITDVSKGRQSGQWD